MIITKDYLDRNKTTKGAYTRRQLSILGIAWPPIKGWKSLILGKVLTSDEANEFEAAKNIKPKKRVK